MNPLILIALTITYLSGDVAVIPDYDGSSSGMCEQRAAADWRELDAQLRWSGGYEPHGIENVEVRCER